MTPMARRCMRCGRTPEEMPPPYWCREHPVFVWGVGPVCLACYEEVRRARITGQPVVEKGTS